MFTSNSNPLEKRKILKKTLGALPAILVISILGFVISIATFITDIEPQFFITHLPFILLSIVILYQIYYYKFYYYNFGKDKAQIKKGVFSQSTGFVRYERIQNVYVDQDFLDLIFGLYDVHYETAGETSGAYLHVDGLNKENMQKLLDLLINKTKQTTKKEEACSTGLSVKKSKILIDNKSNPILEKYVFKETLLNAVFLTIAGQAIFIEYIAKLFTEVFISTNFWLFLINLFVLSLVLSFIYRTIWFRNFNYEFSKDSGLVTTKVFVLNTTHLYYDRIQNVNITQGPVEFLFGLFSISIETASSHKVVIPGFSKSGADNLKEFLLNKISQNKSNI